MTHIQENNQLHNKVISRQTHDEQKGKDATMTRQTWAVISLLAAGFFLHDAVWHIMLVLFGMNAFVGKEFSLPDLGAYHIYSRSCGTNVCNWLTALAWFAIRQTQLNGFV